MMSDVNPGKSTDRRNARASEDHAGGMGARRLQF